MVLVRHRLCKLDYSLLPVQCTTTTLARANVVHRLCKCLLCARLCQRIGNVQRFGDTHVVQILVLLWNDGQLCGLVAPSSAVAHDDVRRIHWAVCDVLCVCTSPHELVVVAGGCRGGGIGVDKMKLGRATVIKMRIHLLLHRENVKWLFFVVNVQ